MARIRSVHPSLFTDESWVSCCPMARLLFIGLWTEADDQGLFEWRPVQIKMRLFPADNADVAALLKALADVDLIAEFRHDGKSFGAIKEFRKFQKPKKPNAIHVLPDEWRTYVHLHEPSSELVDDEAGDIPPKGEKLRQMEDGGWRGEEGKGKDANASSVAAGDRTDVFQKLWKAYPHETGRSSYPKALTAFKKVPKSIFELLPGAASKFAASKSIPPGGAASLQRWIAEELYRDWLQADAPVPPAPIFPNTSLRDRLVEEMDTPWVASYLDHCQWRDIPEPQIVAQFQFTADKIRDGLLKLRPPENCRVVVEKAA